MVSVLDKLYADFDEEEARQELEDAKRRVRDLQEALALFERYRDQGVDVVASDRQGRVVTAQAKFRASNGKRGRTSRAEILSLIRQSDPRKKWTTPRIRDALGLGPEADHGIQVALSRLTRDSQLRRLKMGVYKASPRAATQGEEDEG
jgi:hypothetical protein